MRNLKHFILFNLLLLMAAAVFAQDTGEYERRKARLEKEIEINILK